MIKNDKIKLPLNIIDDLDADLGKIHQNHYTLLTYKDINLSLHDKSIIQKISNDFVANLTYGVNNNFITNHMKNNGCITYRQMKILGNMFSELKQGNAKLSKQFINNKKLNGIADSNLSMVDLMGRNLHKYAVKLGFY